MYAHALVPFSYVSPGRLSVTSQVPGGGIYDYQLPFINTQGSQKVQENYIHHYIPVSDDIIILFWPTHFD